MKKKSTPGLFRRIADFFYGYDFFISYTRREGPDDPGGAIYAEGLNAELESAGFRCFLDSHDYAMGDAWKGIGARKLTMTSQLILVASGAALDAPAVVRENEIFSKKGKGRIIPIDFGGTIRVRDETKPIFQYLADDILFLEEDPRVLSSGPSQEVVTRLRAGFDLTRQDSKRARFFAGISLVFGIISLVAIVTGVLAQRNALAAKKSEIEANFNLIESHTIQGQENVERGNYPAGAAYLAQAIRKATETEQGEQAEEAVLKLSAVVSSGRFPVLLASLEHSDGVRRASFSPSAQAMVSSALDDTVRIWSKEGLDWSLVGEVMKGAEGLQHASAFTKDERVVAVGLKNKVRLLEMESGLDWRPPLVFAEEVLAVDWISNDQFLLVQFSENLGYEQRSKGAVIVKVSSGEVIKKFKYSWTELTVVSPRGNAAIFGGKVVMLKPPYETRPFPFEAPTFGAFRNDDRTMLVADQEVLGVFDYVSGSIIPVDTGSCYEEDARLLEQFFKGDADYSIDHAGKSLLAEQKSVDSPARTNVILAEIVEEEVSGEVKKIGYLGFHQLPNRNVFLDSLGANIAIETSGESIQIVDKLTLLPVSVEMQHTGGVLDIAFSEDGGFFATMASDRYLRIWSAEFFRYPSKEGEFSLPVTSTRWLPRVFFQPDSNFLVNPLESPLFRNDRFEITNDDDEVTVLDGETGEAIFGPLLTGGRVLCAAISPDGRYLACGHNATSQGVPAWATVWNLQTGERVMRLEQGESQDAKFLGLSARAYGSFGVVGVAFSPDSRRVATLCARFEGYGDQPLQGWQLRRAKIWDLEKKRPVSDWLEAAQRMELSSADQERLSCKRNKDTEFYLQEVRMKFSADGESLDFWVGKEKITTWPWAQTLERSTLCSLVDCLTGLRYSEKLGRLVAVPDWERIKIWKEQMQSESTRTFLNGGGG